MIWGTWFFIFLILIYVLFYLVILVFLCRILIPLRNELYFHGLHKYFYTSIYIIHLLQEKDRLEYALVILSCVHGSKCTSTTNLSNK